MLDHTEWLKSNKSKPLPPDLLTYLQKGIIYLGGRDNSFRPVAILQAKMINDLDLKAEDLITLFVFFIQYIIDELQLPGQVECMNMIFDLNGLGMFSIPYNIMSQVVGCIQKNFRGRLYKCFMTNAPYTVNVGWKVAQVLLEQSTKEKISITSKQCDDEMWKVFNKEQIEVKYGGFVENMSVYWPYVPIDMRGCGVDGDDRCVGVEEYQRRIGEKELDGHRLMPLDMMM